VMDHGVQASEKALHGYMAFHRLLLAFVELFPELLKEVDRSIESFLKNPGARVKSKIPSLGDWLALVAVSSKYSWRHVAKPVVDEAFDRNVIWICKGNPTLATLADLNGPQNNKSNNNNNGKPGVEQKRLDDSFEFSQVSLRLLLFHSYFLSRVARPVGASLAQIADNYDRYYGRPSGKTLDAFQQAVKKIQDIKGWPHFFFLAGLPCPTPAGLTQTLRDCVRNSKKKRYHDDNTNFRAIQKSGTSVILKRGDSYSAPRNLEKVEMVLSWGYVGASPEYLDASCFEFSKTGVALSVVDYSSRSTPNMSIRHSGDTIDFTKKTVQHTINIALSTLQKETTHLVFTITAFTGTLAHAKLPWIRMSDQETNSELCQYVLDQSGAHTAVIMCILHKNPIKKCWDLKVLGKFDEGRAPSYIPLEANIGALLKAGY